MDKTQDKWWSTQTLKDLLPHYLPVFGSHVKRIGFFRVFMGGFSMYISLPFIIVHHVLYLYVFSNFILFHLAGVPKLKFCNYIIIDRYRITQLPWFDRINCVYCGYANGIAMFWDAKLDQIDEHDFSDSGGGHLVLTVLAMLLLYPVSLIYKLQSYVVYDLVVSRFLGLHRVSVKELYGQLKTEECGKRLKGFYAVILLGELLESRRLNNALEQIETAWCPFRHLDNRPEVVYPHYHSFFLRGDEVEIAKKTLQTEGTFSPRKPLW
jgi:hypothetical protein